MSAMAQGLMLKHYSPFPWRGKGRGGGTIVYDRTTGGGSELQLRHGHTERNDGVTARYVQRRASTPSQSFPLQGKGLRVLWEREHRKAMTR